MNFLFAKASSDFLNHLTFAASSAWVWCFAALAIVLLASGLDDLVPILICARQWLFVREKLASRPLLEGTIEARRIAIFVPCWKESAVIGKMVRHNLAAIRYNNYDFFLGTYPNDQSTVEEARKLADFFPNVHVALCDKPGPTSKADCLNTVFRRMSEFEAATGARFDTVVLHDAEDMIHPAALSLINRERMEYEMVQVPVLPLATPFSQFTHGVYCDEFSEFQTIDMHARQYSGSFVPSNGVGTGFAREVLDRLASERGDVFDASSLTEDYEIGIYIHAAKYRQKFAPLTKSDKDLVATREYFPRTVRTAIRQRTRWVTGIALQCWERRGWQGDWPTKYWFWRDRKGLVTSPLSLLTNFVFLAGLIDWCASAAQHRPWMFAIHNSSVIVLCVLTTLLQCLRIALRMVCVGRIFGTAFAMGVPLRVFHGNLINCFASLRALWRYSMARRSGGAHEWQKTDHAYPTGDTLVHQRAELAEVLLQSRLISADLLAMARALHAGGGDLGDSLLSLGLVSEENLCRARSLHAGVISGRVDASEVNPRVLRTLPRHIMESARILPVGVKGGQLIIVGVHVPSPEMFEQIRKFTALPIDFQLVTQGNFDELAKLAWA